MELFERFARNELDAFETIFRQYQGAVYAWILRIVRDPAAAEELTVEAFWRIYRARARFDPGRDFAAWARRIATNVALDHLHQVRPEVELPENLPARPDPDPAVQRDIREGMRRAFSDLPPRLRIAAVLHLVEGRPQAEVAEALGISENAVKVRVFRAVRKLRKTLEQLGVRP